MKKNLLLTVIIVVLVVLAASIAYINLFSRKIVAPSPKITSFEDCISMGKPVQESYPRRCTFDGESFTEDIGNTLEKQNLIQLTLPSPNQVVKSPLNIEGQARGKWFFEASFSVKILDANDKVLGTAVASTTSEWTTDNFVPFTSTLTFETPTTQKGKLVLQKDNPSGLVENDDFLEIPIKFK